MVRNLRLLRKQKNISQQQLATVLGVSQQSINKYENHTVEPDIQTLINMADYFGTSVDFLIGRHPRTVDADFLTERELSMLDGYRILTAEEKTCIDVLVETYNKDK